MDSDGFAMKNLDHLFYIDMGYDHNGNGVQIAAPQGYWFKDNGLLHPKDHCSMPLALPKGESSSLSKKRKNPNK